jgi:chromosome segregation ATPase
MKSAEYRNALASLESMRPTLERILKAAQAGAQQIETQEERQQTLERNIAGLQERERRAHAAASEAKSQADRLVKEIEEQVTQARNRQELATQALDEARKRLAAVNAEAGQASRTLTDLRHAIEDAERRAQKTRERAERIAAAAEEAAKA